MKLLKKAILVFLSVCMIVTMNVTTVTVGAASQTVSSSQALKDKQKELENEYKRLKQELEDLQGKKADQQTIVNKTKNLATNAIDQADKLQAQVDALQSEIKKLEGSIAEIEGSIASTEQEIAAAQEQIKEKEAKFDSQKSEYYQRLRAMYISGNVTNLEVLLTCDDMSSFLTRMEMIDSVSKQDKNVLTELMQSMTDIKNSKKELESKVASLEERKKTLNDNKQQLLVKKADIEPTLQEAQDKKKEAQTAVNEANKQLQILADQTNEHTENMSANIKEQAGIENEIQDAIKQESLNTTTKPSTTKPPVTGGDSDTTTGGGSSSTGTSFLYPCAGYYTSKDFNRFPNYGDGSYHGGVDFSVPKGTPVRASESGKVILRKTLDYSYGYYILIDHQNGYQTLYAHNSQLLVNLGDYVTRGQVIAYSGSTGNSTGPHCHFELRKNGTQINPKNYLVK